MKKRKNSLQFINYSAATPEIEGGKTKKGESVRFIKTNNIKKLKKEIQSIRDRLNNIIRY